MGKILFIIFSIFQISLLAEIENINISSTSHKRGVVSNLNYFTVNWTQPETTDNEKINRYFWKIDNNSSSNLEDDYQAKEISISNNSMKIDISNLQDGEYYFHIIAITDLGNSGVNTHFGKIIIDRTSPTLFIFNEIVEDKAVEIFFSSNEQFLKIFYTLDGTTPSDTSSEYIEKFKIFESSTVKYIAIDSAKNSSLVFEKSINVNYVGNVVSFLNIENEDRIATSSKNGATKITPQIVVTATQLEFYRYKFDSTQYSELISKDVPINLQNLNDGTHTLYVEGVDNLGNFQTSVSKLSFIIDNNSPKFIDGYIDNQIIGVRNIFSTNKSLTLFSDDNSSIRYTTDGDTPSRTFGKIYSGAIPITKNISLKIVSYDDLGNMGDIQLMNIIIDREKPTLPIIFDNNQLELNISNPAYYRGKYLFKESQNFSFKSKDNYTDNPTIFWSNDGKTPTILDGNSKSVLINSTSTLKFISADEVNNSTDIQTFDILIDKNSPKYLSYVLSDSCEYKDGVYNCSDKNIQVELKAFDNETPDVLDIFYTLNGKDPSQNDAKVLNKDNIDISLSQNETNFKFIAYDKVRNRSEIISFKVKYYIPENILSTSLSVSNNSVINRDFINISIENGGDTIGYYYKIDENEFLFEQNKLKPIDISQLSDGQHQLTLIALSGDINSTSNSISFQIDRTPPLIPIVSGNSPFEINTIISISNSENYPIYFSTDGAIPTQKYSENILVDKTTVIRAFSIDEIGNKSQEIQKTFSKYESENPDEEPNENEPENPDVSEPENPDDSNNPNEEPDVSEPENPDSDNPETPDTQEPVIDLPKDDWNIVNIISENSSDILTIQNSNGDSRFITISYPEENIDFSDDGTKGYIFDDGTISQNTFISPDGKVSIDLESDENIVKADINLGSQSIHILKDGKTNLRFESTSNSGRIFFLDTSISITELNFNIYINGKKITFPNIQLYGEDAKIEIILMGDNSINLELEVPLSTQDLIF